MIHSKTKRWISALLVGFVALDFTCPAGALASIAESSVPQGVSTQQFSLPKKMGSIEFRSAANKPLKMILLQDAHGIVDAQRSLANILRYTSEEYGVSKIGVEGVSGPLSRIFYQSVPNRDNLKTLLRSALKSGELSGVVWAAIFGKPEVEFMGVEDQTLFNEGLSLYLNAQGQSHKAVSWLSTFREGLAAYKKNHYSQELLKADQLVDSLSKSYENLGQVLKEFGEMVPPPKDSALALLREWGSASENEKHELSAALLVFAEELRGHLQQKQEQSSSIKNIPSQLKRLAQKTQDFRVGGNDPGAFSSDLVRLAEDTRWEKTIPSAIEKAARQHSQLVQIQGGFFHQELKSYIHSVYESLANTEDLKKIVLLTNFLRLNEALFDLKMTRSDWDELQTLHERIILYQDEFQSLDVREFLIQWNVQSLAARLFYQNAVNREKEMLRALISLSKKSPDAPIAVVLGGFHTAGIQHYLDSKKIAYAVVNPAIQHLPKENHYSAQMGGHVSWSRYLVAENGELNYAKAFARHIRDELMARQDDPQGFLKDWRLSLLRSGPSGASESNETLEFVMNLLDEVREKETSSIQANWPWQDFNDFMSDARRQAISASGAGSGIQVMSATRPAEAVSAAVLAQEMSFRISDIESWRQLPSGSIYQQVAVNAKRSEVRNAQLFQEKVIIPISGAIDPLITVETKTNEKGEAELWLEHTAPYENFKVHFTYRIVFHDSSVAHVNRYPQYSLEGEEKKINTLYVPKLQDGQEWDKVARQRMGKMWRRVTIADPLLNKRFTQQGFELAYYQKKAVNVLNTQLESNQKALGVMATATGKTVVAFKVAEKQLKKAKALLPTGQDAGAVIFLVNNIQVLSDAEVSWHRMFNGKYSTSRIYEGVNDISGDIIFATPASLAGSERLQDLLAKRKVLTVIVDEVHHLPAETPKQIFRVIEEQSIVNNWKTQFLGLTATETRPDHASVIAFFGNDIHYDYPIKSGWTDGYLVRWKYKAGDLDINPTGISPIVPGVAIYEHYRAMRYDSSRYPTLLKLYKKERKKVLIPKGLIISSKVKKARELANYFAKRGINAITLVGEDRTDDPVRFKHSYEAWKTGHWPEGSPYANEPVPEVVIGVDIFREGVDVPAINILMLWDDTNSTIEFVQSVGRGLRIAPFKNYISIIDTVGLFRKLSLLRYLGNLSIKRKNPRKKIDDDDEEEVESDAKGLGLDQNVSNAVNHFFNDTPSNLIYRYKIYENMPISAFKQLDKWIAKRASFSSVTPAEGDEDPEEKALETYLTNYARKYLLDGSLLTEEAIVEFRKRFAYAFDIDASMGEGVQDPFPIRDETYLVFRRIGDIIHRLEPRADRKLLERIVSEFDEQHQAAMKYRASNLSFFRRAVLEMTEAQVFEYGRKVLQKAKVDGLVYSSWEDAIESAESINYEGNVIWRAENAVNSGHVNLLGKYRKREQYDQYAQEEVLRTYLTDPRFNSVLSPQDFELPHEAFINKLRDNLLLGDDKALKGYVEQLERAIQEYIAALKFEERRADLPARRDLVVELMFHELFEKAVTLEILTPEIFKKWFDLFWQASQEGRFNTPSEENVRNWFLKLAEGFGFFFTIPIAGLSRVSIEVFRSGYNQFQVSLVEKNTVGMTVGQHSAPVVITPAGDILLNEDHQALANLFENLDPRAQGLIIEELILLTERLYAMAAPNSRRKVVVLSPNETALTNQLRSTIIQNTDWDVFSELALEAETPEERAAWRLTLFDFAPLGEKWVTKSEEVPTKGVDAKGKKKYKSDHWQVLEKQTAAYLLYVKYFNYWNYARLRTEEGLKGIQGRLASRPQADDLLSKAIPMMESAMQLLMNDSSQTESENEFLPIAFQLSNALGFYTDQEIVTEEQLRMANVLLLTLQRRARNYYGNKPYEVLGEPFTTWKEVTGIRSTLRAIVDLQREVYFAGEKLPEDFLRVVDGYLTQVEADSATIAYKYLNRDVEIEIEKLRKKLAQRQPLVQEVEVIAEVPKIALPILSGGVLYVVSHPRDPKQRQGQRMIHLDPSHAEIPKGDATELIPIDDAQSYGLFCPECFAAAFHDHPEVEATKKSVVAFQDDQGDTLPQTPDDVFWNIQETLKRSEVRQQSAQPLSVEETSAGIGDLFLREVVNRSLPELARQRLAAANGGTPALETVYTAMRQAYTHQDELLLARNELMSEAGQEMSEFMRSEFADLGQGGQGVVFGIRIPDTAAVSHDRIRILTEFIQTFLPTSDQTHSHAIITGATDLQAQLREALKRVGVHTSSSRKVTSLLSHFSQNLFPDIVLDSRFEAKSLDVSPRSVELRETRGETRETQKLAVELEAIHAFALARYGDGEALQAFYQRLSSSVSLFKQYPDVLYSSIIQSGGNRDFVDLSILSAYLNLLTAQLAAAQQLAQSA